ncbi:MAG: sulfite exporter TauE/SafE family protein [Syntrophobacter sp.]
MRRNVLISLFIALAATFFMLYQHNGFALQSSSADSTATLQFAQSQAPQSPGATQPAAAVELKIDKTELDTGGTITLSGIAPAGKPVLIEVWAEETVRASRFDSDFDKETGKRPYILYMTDKMPAFFKILVPTDKQSAFAAIKAQGRGWSYSQALKELGAEPAYAAACAAPVQRYQASLLGSVVGSRGELLPAMNEKDNARRAMQLVKARFRNPEAVFAPIVEVKPDGSFNAKLTLNQGSAKGKFSARAVVAPDIASQTVSFQNHIGFPYIYLSNAGTSLNLVYPFLLSLAISIFGVLMGAGGGFILNPLLVSIWPLPHTVVAGTVMPTVLFSQLSGVVNYSRIKFINWKLGASIGLAMLLGGFIGPKLTELISLEQYKFVFGWILVILAGLLVWQTTPAYIAKNSKEQAILREYRKKAEEEAKLAKA